MSAEQQTVLKMFLASLFCKPKPDSCWFIEFESGHKVILSEELYEAEVERNWAGDRVLSEARWYSIEECRKRNRGVLYVE